MSTLKDIEQRLRAARPVAEVPCPPVSTLVKRIEQAAHEPQPRRRSRRGGLALPVAIGVLVLAAASAGAALLLSSGETVAPAFVLPATPAAGLGEPVPQSLALLPMRVADTEGGPPWGMRVIRTTRGLLCLQAGRVVDGQLGALGTGYAFHADKRFHPFLADDAISTDACPAVGASGTAFLPGPPVIVPANGLPLAGENVSQSDQVHCDLPGQQDWGVRCPQSELRQVAVGLLGPNARSIGVTNADGSSFTIDPYGPGRRLSHRPASTAKRQRQHVLGCLPEPVWIREQRTRRRHPEGHLRQRLPVPDPDHQPQPAVSRTEHRRARPPVGWTAQKRRAGQLRAAR